MKIGLLGHGVVGGGVTEITDSCKVRKVRRLEVTKILVKDEWELTDPRCTQNAEEILNDPEIEVIAECMGGIEPAHTFAARALESGKHVVTSNKKMFATCAAELLGLAKENGVSVRYEAAVGGGIPWMSNLERTERLEPVTSFRGIFNGTTNYIISRMEETGAPFAEHLAEAQSLGYAERNPVDDIDGHDVRYKTALTALKAFHTIVNPDDIPAMGIRTISPEDLSWAKEHQMAVRLFGYGKTGEDSVTLWVMPVMISEKEVFADIQSNFNAIESESKTLGKAVFVGQGAGALPTAHAVVQDLLDIYEEKDPRVGELVNLPVDNSEEIWQFYIRTAVPAFFAEIAAEQEGNVVLTRELSIQEMFDLLKECGDESVFAAVVMK
ncbi:MAG: homoserine dehydrogenase [Solobacterium sp.]|nr:homoserine dehydrogenase [Solobacterium sp.]